MIAKQDGAGYRTPTDVARRYKLGDIETNTEDIEEIRKDTTCDTALSTTSTAPVQNKVITTAINTKVTKEAGKGLSTNDFTDTYKNAIPSQTDKTNWNEAYADKHTHTNKTLLDNISQNDIDRWNSAGSAPVGVISQYAGSTAPNGWMICDGSEISRTDYSTLFSVIGTTYGTGDGSTTFNIPNLKGRIPVGLDSNQTEFDTLGETGGSKAMQKHTHTYAGLPLTDTYNWSAPNMRVAYVYTAENPYPANVVSSQEGTGTSGNLQPYIVTNYIIKV